MTLRFWQRRTQKAREHYDRPAFPSRQLGVLALCRICEPIAFMSIFPYIYYMVQSFNITSDERQIAIYAGMVTSAFAFAEFSTGVFWGRLSDVVGRKPILLTGLAGTGLSMIAFGFAPSLPVALVARALGGLLNGNIGVLQTTVAEVVKVKEHQPRAYAIMPFVWCVGSIIGSGLGGSLADPVKNYPSVFRTGTIFERFPYLLPNIICACVVLCGLIIGILFLEETHEQKKHRRDVGLEIGSWLIRQFRRPQRKILSYSKLQESNYESAALIQGDDRLPAYSSTESSPQLTPRLSSTPAPGPAPPTQLLDDDLKPTKSEHSISKAFNRQVLLTIVAYGILAFHTISFEQLMPVLLSMPESEVPPVLPFKFTGGFALPTKTIGFILSIQGFYQMFFQLFVFPLVIRKFGCLKTFKTMAILYPFLYLVVPYLALLPKSLRMPGVALILVWKITFQALAYPSNALLLTNAAPSLLVLGAINGVAASSASLCRAVGPTVSGVIQSAGLKIGYSGLAWWVSAGICIIGAIESLWLRETKGRFDLDEKPAQEIEQDLDYSDQTQDIGIGIIRNTIVDEQGCEEGRIQLPMLEKILMREHQNMRVQRTHA